MKKVLLTLVLLFAVGDAQAQLQAPFQGPTLQPAPSGPQAGPTGSSQEEALEECTSKFPSVGDFFADPLGSLPGGLDVGVYTGTSGVSVVGTYTWYEFEPGGLLPDFCDAGVGFNLGTGDLNGLIGAGWNTSDNSSFNIRLEGDGNSQSVSAGFTIGY